MAKNKTEQEQSNQQTQQTQQTAETARQRVLVLLQQVKAEAQTWRLLCEREGKGTMLPKTLGMRVTDIIKVLGR